MPSKLVALALLCALASPAVAARRHPTCVAVDVEGIPSLICARHVPRPSRKLGR